LLKKQVVQQSRSKDYKETMKRMDDKEFTAIASSEKNLKISPLKSGAIVGELKKRDYTVQTIKEI
jgi:hypothetical protein